MTRLFPSKNYYALPVPVDATDFDIVPHYVRNAIDQRDEIKVTWSSSNITHNYLILKPGNYIPLFTTQNCSEQEAARAVDKDNEFWYKDYESRLDDPYQFATATDSIASLLRSLGLLETNYLIILKKEA